jgi:DtxR family transcriptional regulator, Mn-dependent transcriptional regulator
MAMSQSSDTMRLTASLEDYLEAIWLLVRRHQVARVRDIAGHLKVGMPSVTAALKSLAQRKLVNYEAYGFVTLTEEGAALAQSITGRHDDLRRFLGEVLGLDAVTAEANACRMEHAVDETVLTRLRRFTKQVTDCPHGSCRRK